MQTVQEWNQCYGCKIYITALPYLLLIVNDLASTPEWAQINKKEVHFLGVLLCLAIIHFLESVI